MLEGFNEGVQSMTGFIGTRGRNLIYEAVDREAKKRASTRLKSPLESHEQKAFIQWLLVNKIPHYAIPNGGTRNVREAANMKRQGVSPGIPDICIPYPVSPYHGAYLELKRKDGKPSSITTAQINWIDYLNRVGYKAVIAFGADPAIQFTKDYLGDELLELLQYNVTK